MVSYGDYKISYVTEGFCRLDGGAMFGVVPKALWNRKTPADEKNRIKLALQCLIVEYQDRLIIVDSGCGDKWDEKSKAMYGIENAEGGLEGALNRKGYGIQDVTDVIYTHLHFDHAGGGSRYDQEGRAVRTFPNASYHVQKSHWDWAREPTERDQASFLEENIRPIEEKLNLIDGNKEILPGLTVECANTHTVGHQIVKFHSKGETLVHCGDLIPMSHHVRLPFIMAYDLFPLDSLKEKRKVLESAQAQGWTLFFGHCPRCPAARVKKGKKGFTIEEAIEL